MKIKITEQQIINAIKKVVSEARRNPETNVDESFSEFYNRMLSKAPIEDIFVSFRDSNHVTDVNPVNEYGTPTGYYSYPLSSFDIPENPTEVEFRRMFPFANDRKYINFFILKTHNGLLTKETDISTLNMYAERVKKLYPNSTKAKELCDSFIDGSYVSNYKDSVHDTHLFWLLLYDITKDMEDGKKQNRINLICRKIGVNGFIDYGDKFIHPAEAKQSIFFKIKNLGETFVYEKSKIKAKDIEKIVQNKEYEIVKELTDNIKLITILGKYGLINANGELLNKRRFNYVSDFKNGVAKVELNGKFNFINTDGRFLTNMWFNIVGDFKDGFAKVWVNGKGVNLLNENGKFLLKQWVDWIGHFEGDIVRVRLDNKGMNFINKYGELLSKQWFDDINFFEGGISMVTLNDKSNLITKKGKLLFKQWFDWISDFKNGVAKVDLKGNYNLIDKNGNIILDEWVDSLMSLNAFLPSNSK